jgi:alkylated DNA repair dioxygenase AlkB
MLFIYPIYFFLISKLRGWFIWHLSYKNDFMSKKKILKMNQSIPGFKYFPDVITDEEHSEILKKLTQEKWDNIKDSESSRKVIQYGYKYDYKIRNVSKNEKVEDIPDFLNCLTSKITFERFNQCIINKYLPGQGINAHIDSTTFGPIIVCFTINSGCEIEFEHQRTRNKIKVYVEPKSVYVLTGPSRYDWTHKMCPRMNDILSGKKIPRGERISITFRTV